jgi:Ca2+-binding EF-hand superfamily protein
VQEAQYKKAFDLLDKDRNGYITVGELGAAMRATGQSPSDKELKKMVESVDADKNGKLSFAEFKTLMIRRVNQSEMEALREEFRSYDTDNDGHITVKEAHTALLKQGVKPKSIDKCIKNMFKRADFDKDDRITFEGKS